MLKQITAMTITMLFCLAPKITLSSLENEKTLKRLIIENPDGIFNPDNQESYTLRRALIPASLGITTVFIECILYTMVIRKRKRKDASNQVKVESGLKRIFPFKLRDPKNADEIKFVENANNFVNTDCIKPSDDNYQNKVFIIVSSNYQNPDFDVDALCLAMGISKTKCYSDFGMLYSKTPKEIINNYRLGQGLLLLRSSNKSISTISSEIGFKSHSGFTKGFKKKFGYAPSKIVPFYHN